MAHLQQSIPRWYALHTHHKQEDRVDQNLKAWGVETFNPLIRKRRYNKFTGLPHFVTQALFPRYIFARFDAATMLGKIRYTRGVHSIVSIGDTPSPVSDEIIDVIKSRLDESGYVRLGETFKQGDKVVVTDGPLKDFVGIFDNEMKGAIRVSILLLNIKYQGRVEIEKDFIKKLNATI
jgi:transcription elongation factor/antiterminator RfaH